MLQNKINIIRKLAVVCVTLGLSLQSSASTLLFVSLGMPDLVLKQYLRQANAYHIPVIIRGLYTAKDHDGGQVGSFRDTVDRIKGLVGKDTKNQGVEINPVLFKQFNIQVVPSLVITSDDSCIKSSSKTKLCSIDQYDIVKGNMPIETMLQFVVKNSKNTWRISQAENILKEVNHD